MHIAHTPRTRAHEPLLRARQKPRVTHVCDSTSGHVRAKLHGFSARLPADVRRDKSPAHVGAARHSTGHGPRERKAHRRDPNPAKQTASGQSGIRAVSGPARHSGVARPRLSDSRLRCLAPTFCACSEEGRGVLLQVSGPGMGDAVAQAPCTSATVMVRPLSAVVQAACARSLCRRAGPAAAASPHPRPAPSCSWRARCAGPKSTAQHSRR